MTETAIKAWRLPSGNWQVQAEVFNGVTSWVEVRVYHGIPEKQAIATFYNNVLSMGWAIL